MQLRGRLKKKLAATLPALQLQKVYSAFDLVGDIAIVKIAPDNQQAAEAIAHQIMLTHKGVKTVLSPTSAVGGEHRVRTLQVLAGENRTVAKHREAGCVFSVDVEKCYFSPRLSGERLRIARLVVPSEIVVNMFAGVGCFSVIITKRVPSAKVYSIDINPDAYAYMVKNVELNNVAGGVTTFLGDAKAVIETQFVGVADRVLMPLPEKALENLPAALVALKKGGGWIHYHDFVHADPSEKPQELTKRKVAVTLDGLGVKYHFAFSRVVRSTGPHWYQTVLDINVQR